jgi:hypothetical protein
VEKKFSLKRLSEAFCRFATKRRGMMKLILAIVTMILLSMILHGLIIIQITPNYQTKSTTLNQVTPNSQTNNTTPNQVRPTQPPPTIQPKITIPNPVIFTTIGIGAYWDADLTNTVNAIDWGALNAGTQKSFTIYIRNEGNSAITLIKSTSNWNPPAASNYITLDWNYNGQTINAGENLRVTLTLSVSASITGISNFSFDITIAGSG